MVDKIHLAVIIIQIFEHGSAHTHTGGEHSHQWDNEPTYYVLAFIIFVGN